MYRPGLLIGLTFCCGAALASGSGPFLSPITLSSTPTELVAQAQQTPVTVDAKGRPFLFAVPIATAITPLTSGVWFEEDGRDVWRVQIESTGAFNLSFNFAQFRLPQGGEMRLYDDRGFLHQGPYTAADNRNDGRYWSAIVPGERALIEVSVPDGHRNDLQLVLSTVNHGFRRLRDLAKSGSCNIDVACSVADPWAQEVRATARITIGNQRLCSAMLLNNTRGDGEPLLLTAKHCGIGENEDLSDDSVRVYWNYETSSCGGSPDGNLSQNQLGSTLLAEAQNADFALVRLDDVPRPEFNVFYAGWDASDAIPDSGATLHHPSGHEKRISFFERDARRRTALVDGKEVASWEVFWSDGVTEPGSSGSGLWNESHRVVGLLSGGNSSCSNPDGSDVYGRLEVAWDGNPERGAQLKAWLDPDNTGELAIDGIESGDGEFRARNDSYERLPQNLSNLSLAVLQNDIGSGPLTLVSATASSGEVSINGNQLDYTWAAGSNADTITYVVADRFGQTTTATAELKRAPTADAGSGLGRGTGSAGTLLLILALAGLRRRRH